MSEEEIMRRLQEWRESEEYKQIERVIDIYMRTQRAYQATIDAMYQAAIFTTDNTRSTRDE